MLMVSPWVKRTSQAVKDYEDGILDPKRPWAKTTCEAADRYKAGVDKAYIENALQSGVIKTGGVQWATKTLLKGPTRFAQGVSGAGDTYAEGYMPYHKVILGTSLPARFPTGDPRNIYRCSAICTALSQAKEGEVTTDPVTCPDT